MVKRHSTFYYSRGTSSGKRGYEDVRLSCVRNSPACGRVYRLRQSYDGDCEAVGESISPEQDPEGCWKDAVEYDRMIVFRSTAREVSIL